MSLLSVAREQGADLPRLLSILRLRRPDKSKTEDEFAIQLMTDLNATTDTFGNFWVEIGDAPTTMWSCHTDTVSKTDGFQNICWDGNILRLHKGKPGQSLGADDGAGLWLMLEMIKAKKPGLYIFHRAEEVGGQGSSYIAKNNQGLLKGIKRAIAFDRKGTGSIITRQGFERTCSDKFGEDLADALNFAHNKLMYKIDDTGVFTDTANYEHLIAECTNVSVGYYQEHGPNEHLDVLHLLRLRQAVLEIDFENIAAVREPGDIDDEYGFYGWSANKPLNMKIQRTPMEQLILDRVVTIAKLMEAANYTTMTLDAMCNEYWLNQGRAAKATAVVPTEEESEFITMLWCNECTDSFEPWPSDQWSPGDKCPMCGCVDTEVEQCRKDLV